MMTLVANWKLLYQGRSAWLFCGLMFIGFGVAIFPAGGGNSAGNYSQVGVFLWVAASVGALSAMVWKEAMGKPHSFCLPKRKHETGAVSLVSGILLLFVLSSVWFGIRFPAEGVNAFTEATALFIYGCAAFLIGTWMAFRFPTIVVFNFFFLLPIFAISLLSDFTSSLIGTFGRFLLTCPLVSIPVGIIAAIALSVYTWNQTGRIDQRRKLCFSADPGLAVFNPAKAMQFNRIRERQTADKKAPPVSDVLTRERREAFFLRRLKRAHSNPTQQYMWGYIYRLIGNPKVMNRATLPYPIIGLLVLGPFFAWLSHGKEMAGSSVFFQGMLIMMFGAFAPLPLLRPMTLIVGRKERLSTVLVLFFVYTFLAIGLLLVLNLSVLGTSALIAQFSSLAHKFQEPTLGWTALTSPLFILPLLFLARLDLARLGRGWLWGAFCIGVAPIALLMLLSPVYQAGLGVLMWAGCIWRYRRHFRRAPLISQSGDDSLDLLFRG